MAIECEVCHEPLKVNDRIVWGMTVADDGVTAQDSGSFHEAHWPQREGHWIEGGRGYGAPETPKE